MTLATYSIKHVNVLSVAKIGAVLGLIFGLIEGIVIGVVMAAVGSTVARGLNPLMGLGIGGLIIFFAIVVGLIGGFVGGAVWAFIYNVAAGYVGPIQVELETQA